MKTSGWEGFSVPTGSEIVARQYEAWVYPQPVPDLAEFLATGIFDLADPAHFRRKLWPRKIEPDDLSILVAGCGTNQAAQYAFTNRNSQVLGIDISTTSLEHEAYLKQKHHLDNLELRQLSLAQVGSLGCSFDLIVSTGVLHHLPDPDSGLRSLRDVLRPHGVMSLMLYGRYLRVGVYMMQEAFRVLGLKQDAEGIGMMKHAIDALPQWHHLQSYKRIAPDLSYDSGLVDTFLHPVDRAFTVQEIMQFAQVNEMKFQSWLDNLDYSVSACVSETEDPIRKRAETLPPVDQWRLVELMGQSLGTHRFLLCHPGKDEDDYALDFTGTAWLDYVPTRRHPLLVAETKHGIKGLQVDPAIEPLVIQRSWQAFALETFESALLEQVNGQRPIRDILRAAPGASEDETSLSAARQFFLQMAEWDHLTYQIP
jgi:SAM-dependent methyltransferase